MHLVFINKPASPPTPDWGSAPTLAHPPPAAPPAGDRTQRAAGWRAAASREAEGTVAEGAEATARCSDPAGLAETARTICHHLGLNARQPPIVMLIQ